MHAALVELASYQPSDVSAYASQYAITPQIANYSIDGGNASTPGNVEAALDIELLLANAPNAAIDVYNAPNDGTGTGLVDAYGAVASANNAQVLSLEWVNCEAGAVQVSGFVGAQHRIFQQLAAQGTTVVSATGDAGAYGCADQVPGTDPLANTVGVNLPASDPYVLAVGATDLAFTSQNGAATVSVEGGWSCAPTVSSLCASTSPHGAGSGGGVSVIFRSGDGYGTSLSWQTGAGVSNQYSTGGRQIPDVSISGSYGSAGHEYSIYYQGKWQRGGGTSAAAPEWAALILRIDQNLIQQGLKPLGWANPILYQIANGAPAYPAFHDVQSGNNLYYNATPGWDYVSGLGSPDGWNLLRDVVTVTQAASGTGSQPTVGTRSPTASSSPPPVYHRQPHAHHRPHPTALRQRRHQPDIYTHTHARHLALRHGGLPKRLLRGQPPPTATGTPTPRPPQPQPQPPPPRARCWPSPPTPRPRRVIPDRAPTGGVPNGEAHVHPNRQASGHRDTPAGGHGDRQTRRLPHTPACSYRHAPAHRRRPGQRRSRKHDRSRPPRSRNRSRPPAPRHPFRRGTPQLPAPAPQRTAWGTGPS